MRSLPTLSARRLAPPAARPAGGTIGDVPLYADSVETSILRGEGVNGSAVPARDRAGDAWTARTASSMAEGGSVLDSGDGHTVRGDSVEEEPTVPAESDRFMTRRGKVSGECFGELAAQGRGARDGLLGFAARPLATAAPPAGAGRTPPPDGP